MSTSTSPSGSSSSAIRSSRACVAPSSPRVSFNAWYGIPLSWSVAAPGAMARGAVANRDASPAAMRSFIISVVPSAKHSALAASSRRAMPWSGSSPPAPKACAQAATASRHSSPAYFLAMAAAGTASPDPASIRPAARSVSIRRICSRIDTSASDQRRPCCSMMGRPKAWRVEACRTASRSALSSRPAAIAAMCVRALFTPASAMGNPWPGA
ncbi:hypothetical protein D9M72_279860 [compost metagenome]